MIFILLIVFLILLFVSPKGSFSRFFWLLYIITLSMNFLLGNDLGFESSSDILYLIWTIFVLSFIILPWRRYYGVTKVYCNNPKRVDQFAYIAGIICIIMTIGCFVIAYAISKLDIDINYFKYRGGQAEVFETLGLSMKPYLLAYMLYPLSYLFIPLLFYYLSQKKYKMFLWSFMSSLASVAFGLAYFSRSHTTQYVLILVAMYFFLRNVLSSKIKSIVVKTGVLIIALISASFITISISRFDDHIYANQNSNSIIKNTTLYSAVDYMGMWYYSGRDVFKDYNFENLNGKIAFGGLNKFFSMASRGVIKNNSESVAKERERLLKEHSGGFIGVSAYFLYDTGILFSVLILVLYSYYVNKKKPQKGSVSVENLFKITSLMLLPLFGIFYSTLDVILLLLFFMIFIQIFLKSKPSNNHSTEVVVYDK